MPPIVDVVGVVEVSTEKMLFAATDARSRIWSRALEATEKAVWLERDCCVRARELRMP